MKALLTLGLFCGFAVLSADDKKVEDKASETSKIEGKWKVTAGKKAGQALNDEGKKGHYVFSKDKIKIVEGDKEMFVMEYTMDSKASPMTIDMKIVESAAMPDAKGMKAKGIVEIKGDEMKLAYYPYEDKRPEKFDDDKAFTFTLKKEHEEKKDK